MYNHLNTQQVIDYIKNFKFTRIINQFHIHHTWSPEYASFTGSNHDALQTGMRDYHMKVNGWSDYGVHLTLFPDGVWLLGRDLNSTPASILGWNTGAIGVEMIGNFDTGNNQMNLVQKLAIYELTEFMVEQMKLVAKFHRDSPTSYKTCPGTGINRDTFFKEFANFTEDKLIAQQEQDAIKLQEAKDKAERVKIVMSEVKSIFKDMVDTNGKAHWSNDYVNTLVGKGIIKGSQDANGNLIFQPDKPATKAEVATIAIKLLEYIEEKIK